MPVDIVAADLDRVPAPVGCGLVVGVRLDNQTLSFAALKAFPDAGRPTTSAFIYLSFDNEEIESGSARGARSSFMQDVIACIGAPATFWARSVCALADIE
jgi:aspartyl aminopeptidase